MLSSTRVPRGLVELSKDEFGEVQTVKRTITLAVARCRSCHHRCRVLPSDILPRKTYAAPAIELECTTYVQGDQSLREVAWGLLGDRTPSHTTLHAWTEGLGAYVLGREAGELPGADPFSAVLAESRHRAGARRGRPATVGARLMVRPDVEPLRAILHRALVRYLTVTPQGLVFGDETRKHSSVSARILGFGGARSLYRRRKPICRSLDGIVAIDNPRKRCAECVHHGACTPQVRVDLIARLRAYRMLLAYTSARNFLEYEATLRRDGIAIEDVMHEISVVPRGSWGELRFRRLDY